MSSRDFTQKLRSVPLRGAEEAEHFGARRASKNLELLSSSFQHAERRSDVPRVRFFRKPAQNANGLAHVGGCGACHDGTRSQTVGRVGVRARISKRYADGARQTSLDFRVAARRVRTDDNAQRDFVVIARSTIERLYLNRVLDVLARDSPFPGDFVVGVLDDSPPAKSLIHLKNGR